MDTFKACLVHAPAMSDDMSEVRRITSATKEDEVEPELVSAVTNLAKHAVIHPTKASAREKLLEGYSRSAARFLLCNKIQEVKVNQEIVTRDLERL